MGSVAAGSVARLHVAMASRVIAATEAARGSSSR